MLIAKIIGRPNPPFLIMDPKGAPMKNNIKQESEKAILLWNSISYKFNFFLN